MLVMTFKAVVWGAAIVNVAHPVYKAGVRVNDMVRWYRDFTRARQPVEPWVWVDRREGRVAPIR